MHEGVGQVLAGVQGGPECFSDHESDAGLSGVGHVEVQLEFAALADLSGECWGDAEAVAFPIDLGLVDLLEEVVLGDGWGLFGFLGAVGGGAPQVQGGVQGSDPLDPLPHPPSF